MRKTGTPPRLHTCRFKLSCMHNQLPSLTGEELELVTEFKHLGVILDSSLTFNNTLKNIKFNRHSFKQIRPSLAVGAARMFLHTMMLSHIDYCLTNWSLTGATALKTIDSLDQKALRIFDRKGCSYHCCHIL